MNKDQKFIKSQLSGQTIQYDGKKYKVKTVLFIDHSDNPSMENTVQLITGRLGDGLFLTEDLALELAEKGISGGYSIDEFEDTAGGGGFARACV